MVQAGVFENFKGGTTLLVWGDRDGMASLLAGFSSLRDGSRNEFGVDGPGADLTVHVTSERSSELTAEGRRLRWGCSRETAALAADLTEPLLHEAGHQRLDVIGLAGQVIIACDEYPENLT
jgi:hypothetical protein